VAESLRVGDREIGPGHPTFFIAEEGQANQGNLGVALEMIRVAAWARADAIEFQLAIADDFYVRTHPGHAIYKAREFSVPQLRQLFATAQEAGILAYAAPLSSRLVPVLSDVGCALFNINSSDLNNPDMLDAVAATRCPFFLSTAMATLEEIDWAVERLRDRRCDNFALLHGQHSMLSAEGTGVPEHETNLASIEFLRLRYGVPVGFIDHTSNPNMPVVAALRGAAVVSKHFALSRALQGPDWHICLEPRELADTIRQLRIAENTLGKPEKILAQGEMGDRAQMRRSIVAARVLTSGTQLRPEDLRFKRPGTGLAPREVSKILGRVLKVDLTEDDQLQLEHLR
jgi:sialic acid synthase SpsE